MYVCIRIHNAYVGYTYAHILLYVVHHKLHTFETFLIIGLFSFALVCPLFVCLCVSVYDKVLNVPEKDFMDQMGVCFVSFVSQYGYDRVLSVLGRHMRDFLNGLDNLHEYLKFSYPRMKAPSFICENETKQGLTLHYRSKRRGFVYYTMGQIREVFELKYYITNCMKYIIISAKFLVILKNSFLFHSTMILVGGSSFLSQGNGTY